MNAIELIRELGDIEADIAIRESKVHDMKMERERLSFSIDHNLNVIMDLNNKKEHLLRMNKAARTDQPVEVIR